MSHSMSLPQLASIHSRKSSRFCQNWQNYTVSPSETRFIASPGLSSDRYYSPATVALGDMQYTADDAHAQG